ncbi:hypothetical protein Tco_1155522 [Tanacetum coccineum]
MLQQPIRSKQPDFSKSDSSLVFRVPGRGTSSKPSVNKLSTMDGKVDSANMFRGDKLLMLLEQQENSHLVDKLNRGRDSILGSSRTHGRSPTPLRRSFTTHAAYQADDLDAYDSDCDEPNSAKIALNGQSLQGIWLRCTH